MVIQPQTFATASIPERKDVTADLKRRFKLQEEAKAEAKRVEQLARQSPTSEAAPPQP
jgi:cell division protein FtsL